MNGKVGQVSSLLRECVSASGATALLSVGQARLVGYPFIGVRPSSAAATPARSIASDISQAASFSSVSAPEHGRTPLNTYEAGSLPCVGPGPVPGLNSRRYLGGGPYS